MLLKVFPSLSQTASFAVGNAAYHSDTLYTPLSPAVPRLVVLLTDSVARTRANAAGENFVHVKLFLQKELFLVTSPSQTLLQTLLMKHFIFVSHLFCSFSCRRFRKHGETFALAVSATYQDTSTTRVGCFYCNCHGFLKCLKFAPHNSSQSSPILAKRGDMFGLDTQLINSKSKPSLPRHFLRFPQFDSCIISRASHSFLLPQSFRTLSIVCIW